MEIRELKQNEMEVWNRIVDESNEAWLFHLQEWGQISKEVFGTTTQSLVAEDNGELLGVMPIAIREKFPFKWIESSFRSTGGPALVPNLGAKHINKINTSFFNYIDEISKAKNIDWVNVRLDPLAPNNLPPLRSQVNPLVEYNFIDKSSFVYIISLEPTERILWENLEQRTRRTLRKSEKSNIKIIEKVGEEAVKEYYSLHKESYARSGGKPFPITYFRNVHKKFGEKGRQHFFFAEYNGENIGALSIGSYKQGAHYWSGASKTEFLNLGINELLQWHAIKWAKEKGYSWYNCTDVLPYSKNQKLRGIYLFKRSFGGKLFQYYKGLRIYSKYKRLATELIQSFVMNKESEVW